MLKENFQAIRHDDFRGKPVAPLLGGVAHRYQLLAPPDLDCCVRFSGFSRLFRSIRWRIAHRRTGSGEDLPRGLALRIAMSG